MNVEDMTQEEQDAWAKSLLAKAAKGDVQSIIEIGNILDGEPEYADYE